MARLALKQALADLNLPLMILNRHGSIQVKLSNGEARPEMAID